MSSVNRYSVPKRHGDKMLSLINRYHSTGSIDMMKTDKDIIFTVISDSEKDFFDYLPDVERRIDEQCRTSMQSRLLNRLISCIKRHDDVQINFKNVRFIDLLEVCQRIPVEKILVVDNMCIFLGYCKRVYRVDYTGVRRRIPKFNLFKGFSEDTGVDLDYLNIIHEEWIRRGMKGRLFEHPFIDTYDMTVADIRI